MNWQCRLYGHSWRHPGTPEVVVSENAAPTYPIRCDVCGREKFVTTDGRRID